jgi:hypothetical protein
MSARDNPRAQSIVTTAALCFTAFCEATTQVLLAFFASKVGKCKVFRVFGVCSVLSKTPFVKTLDFS